MHVSLVAVRASSLLVATMEMPLRSHSGVNGVGMSTSISAIYVQGSVLSAGREAEDAAAGLKRPIVGEKMIGAAHDGPASTVMVYCGG